MNSSSFVDFDFDPMTHSVPNCNHGIEESPRVVHLLDTDGNQSSEDVEVLEIPLRRVSTHYFSATPAVPVVEDIDSSQRLLVESGVPRGELVYR